MTIPELHPAFTPQEAVVEANRCLYCFDAPCAAACPTHIDVPRFIKKIASANLRGSANTILESNVLGLSCSRVCPVDVLCEGSCVMHRYNKQPIEIGRLQRHAMETWYDSMETRDWAGLAAPVRQTQKIACIGAGPASLACAAELRKQGYAVTLFEARQRPGGLNTYGVAEYKFTAGDAAREVEFLGAIGVDIRTGVEVGKDIAIDQLESQYDAIFLGLGLGPTQKLGIPGENLPGVIDAVRFIAAYKTEARYDVGTRTIVIGGGNTAIDAAIAARILGAEESIMAYRRGESEMPAFEFEYDHAKAFGVRFQWNVAPVRIVGEDTVQGVEFACTESGTLKIIEGANFTVGCDMVIVALGQSKLGAMLGDRLQIKDGRIVADPSNGVTTNPKYYAAGDCTSGGREVVDAVAEGKREPRTASFGAISEATPWLI